MNKLLQNPGALTNMIRRIAIEAGEIVLDYYDDLLPEDIDRKGDGSPVSEADRKAEAFIQKALKDLIPELPFVGEEAFAEGRADDVTGAPYYWLVDALDGTKEFISGGEDFTVNIALVQDGVPILGVVYAPVKESLYAGHSGTHAIKWTAETNKDKPITVRRPPAEGLVVVGSKSHGNNQDLSRFLEEFKIQKVVKRGSSLKICAIAEGKADLYPRFGPTCEWDTAAGDAVLRAAGGFLTKVDGTPLVYRHQDPKFLNPEFITAGFDWFADMDEGYSRSD